MQTPGHAVVNVALLGAWAGHSLAVPIFLGAVLPDLPIVVLYLRERARATPEERIWSEVYQRPFWSNLIHGAHSIPFGLAGLAIAWFASSPALAAFFASAVFHALADLPLHAEDAHRHFLPLSSYRFISPISYWDPRHHARYVALGELALVLAATAVLWSRAGDAVRAGLVAVNGWYAISYWRSFLARVLRPT